MVGVALGLLGAGGSIVMLPVLVYVLGLEPHAAVPLSLAVVGATSLVGATLRRTDDPLQWKAVMSFGIAAVVGASLGSRLTHLVPGRVLMSVFGVLLLVVGVRMWRPVRESVALRPPAHPVLMTVSGLLIGVLTGFFGVGGGFLLMPALMRFGGLSIRPAHLRRHRPLRDPVVRS